MVAAVRAFFANRLSPRDDAHLWQRVGVLIPYFWLLIFFLMPFVIVFKISFADPITAQPPFTALFDWTKEAFERIYITFDNYRYLFQDRLYVVTYLNSIYLAAISTSQNRRREARRTVEWDDEVFLSWDQSSTILLNE